MDDLLGDLPTTALFIALFILLVLSAFFSGAETAMMSVNRYRIRNMARRNVRWAKILTEMLENPGRLLSVILIGNNFVNILTSAIATVLGLKLFGSAGILIATATLTIVILIFSEVTPKTFAALYPAKLAAPASFIIYFLGKVFFPVVFIIENITSLLLKSIGVNKNSDNVDQLSMEELRTVLMETSRLIPKQHRDILIGFLDLDDKTVADVMTTKSKVVGIDLSWQNDKIIQTLLHSEYDYLPIYREKLNELVGILRVKDILISNTIKINEKSILNLTKNAYFVPMNANLLTQLEKLNQKRSNNIAMVVDEYGKIKGIITVKDIINDIMKDFLLHNTSTAGFKTKDNNIFVDGGTLIRDINKKFNIDLPIEGPKTISGLIIEELTFIPKNMLCLKIGQYQVDVLKVFDNSVSKAKIIQPAVNVQ